MTAAVVILAGVSLARAQKVHLSIAAAAVERGIRCGHVMCECACACVCVYANLNAAPEACLHANISSELFV